MSSQASKDRKSEYSEIAFLLERIHTAEQCFSTIFTPVLTGLYPQKFELTELYGKYIVACYDLAKFTHTTQLVTEELWEETLPEGSVENDYIASDRRIIEGLTPSSNSSSNYTSWAQHGKGSDGEDEGEEEEFSMLIRNLHLAVTNLSGNFDQLKGRFHESTEVEHLFSFLRPRIGQIENASAILYKHSKKATSHGSERIPSPPVDEKPAPPTLERVTAAFPLNSQKAKELTELHVAAGLPR